MQGGRMTIVFAGSPACRKRGCRKMGWLANNKLLRGTESTNLVRALRREYTTFSASRH